VAAHHDLHSESPAQKSDQPKPCKTAIPCCVAMTSCAMTIALGSGASPFELQMSAQVIPPSYLSQPLSRIAAPEPPPPKV
jgi:hypothetical protein